MPCTALGELHLSCNIVLNTPLQSKCFFIFNIEKRIRFKDIQEMKSSSQKVLRHVIGIVLLVED